jgi:hypothetical protein
MSRVTPAALAALVAVAAMPCVAAKGEVGQYTSAAQRMPVRSYWIEGDHGVILIGAQLLPSAAEAAVREAERVTGKKTVMALLLAATPDQFNGTALLQKRGVKVYTSEQVLRLIPAAHATARERLSPEFKPDYPAQVPKPASLGNSSRQMIIVGVPFRLYVLGSGSPDAYVVLDYEGRLFAGALVGGPAHPQPLAGGVEEWLRRLQELRGFKPNRVYPAQGDPGGAALIANQMIYLRQLLGFMRAEDMRALPGPEAAARVKAKMMEAYPDHAFPENLDALISSEWERQGRK